MFVASNSEHATRQHLGTASIGARMGTSDEFLDGRLFGEICGFPIGHERASFLADGASHFERPRAGAPGEEIVQLFRGELVLPLHVFALFTSFGDALLELSFNEGDPCFAGIRGFEQHS